MFGSRSTGSSYNSLNQIYLNCNNYEASMFYLAFFRGLEREDRYTNISANTIYTEEFVVNDPRYSISSNFFDNSATLPSYLFAFNALGNAVAYSYIRLYGFEIYDGSTLIRDFRPYKDASGVICLYDLVEQKCYYNKGTGSFVAGEEIDTSQVVNYLMLYDGSLGEAGENGANVCADVTGGYEVNSVLMSGYVKGTVTFNSTNIKLYAKDEGTICMATISSNNSFNVDGYSKIGASTKYSMSSPNSNSWSCSYLTQNRSLSSMGESHLVVGSGVVYNNNSLNNTKFLWDKDISSAVQKNYYLCGYASATGWQHYTDQEIYSIFLLKQDNWQELCTIAGLNSSNYASEETLCSNSTAITQILSNASAVDFMLKQCTGTFMYYFVRSSTCLTALNNSTNKTKIHANEHWSKFLMFVS